MKPSMKKMHIIKISLLLQLVLSINHAIYSQKTIFYDGLLYELDYSPLLKNVPEVILKPVKYNFDGYLFSDNVYYPKDTIYRYQFAELNDHLQAYKPIIDKERSVIRLKYYGKSYDYKFDNSTDLFADLKKYKQIDSSFIEIYDISEVVKCFNNQISDSATLLIWEYPIIISNSYIQSLSFNSQNYGVPKRSSWNFEQEIKITKCSINELGFYSLGETTFESKVQFEDLDDCQQLTFSNCIFQDTIIDNCQPISIYDGNEGTKQFITEYGNLMFANCRFLKPVLITDQRGLTISNSEFLSEFELIGSNFEAYIEKSTFFSRTIIYYSPSLILSENVYNNDILVSLELLDQESFFSNNNNNNNNNSKLGVFTSQIFKSDINIYLPGIIDLSTFGLTLEQLNSVTIIYSDFIDNLDQSECILTLDTINTVQGIAFYNKIKQYISEYPSTNEKLKNNAIHRIDYQIECTNLFFNRQNLNRGNLFNYLWNYFVYKSVNFGYEGISYLARSILIILLLFSSTYFIFFRKAVLNFISNESENPIKSNDDTQNSDLLLKWIICLSFSTYLLISLKYRFKLFSLHRSLVYLTLLNWILGLSMAILFVVYVVGQYDFIQNIL